MAVDIGTLRGLLVLDDQFSSKLDIAGSKLEQAGKKWEKVGGSLTSVGSTLNRSVTLPLAAAAGGALTLSTQFETSLTKIETLVGIAGDEVAGMRDRVLELSGETARAPKELADALFVVTSAGARGTTALEILERAAKASASGLGETQDIARAVTAAVAAYGEENLSASRATDVLVATVREGNLEASDLAGSLGRVIGIASQVGVSFEQVGGFVATFTRLGVNAEESVTALRGVLSSAIAPSEGAAKALAEMGLSAEDLRRKIREEGLDAALRDLVERADGNAEALANVIPNVRALSGVLGTAGSQGETFAQINENIANSLGILDDAFGRTTETTGFKFQQFLANLQQVGIRLGDELAPAFERILASGTKVLLFVAKLIEGFSKLPQPVQSAVIALGGIAIAAGPVLTVLGNLTTLGGLAAQGVGKLLPVLGTLRTTSATAVIPSLTGIGGALGGLVTKLGTAAQAVIAFVGPWGLVAAAVGALALAITSFIAKEGGLLENWAAGTTETLASIRGSMTDNVQSVNALADAFRDSFPSITAEISKGVAAGQSYETILETLGTKFAEGTEAGDALRAKLAELEASEMAAGAAAQDPLATGIDTAAGAAGNAAQPLTALDELLQEFGFVTVKNAAGELDSFGRIVDSGTVPTEQLRAKLEELETQYRELGLITPEVRAKLDEITESINTQDAAVDGIIGTVPQATNALDLFGGSLDKLPPKVIANERAWDDLQIALSDNAFQLAEVIAQTEGLTFEQGLALTSYRDNKNELRELAAKLRGEYGPSIQESTERMLGLTAATDEGTRAGGSFFGSLTKGIPILGDLGSSLDGLFNKLGGVFSGDGILGKIGSFFGGGGGEGGGGFFNSIVSGITGALGADGGKIGSIFSGLLGTGLSAAFGPLGGLVSAGITKLGGLAIKGLKALGSKIGGFFGSLFGGPDAAEKEGRQVAGAFRESVRSQLDESILAQINVQFGDQANRENAAFLAQIQQQLIATGVAAEEAGRMAEQFGIRLFEAEKRGGDAVQQVIDDINAASAAVVEQTEKAEQAATQAQETVTENAATQAAKQVEIAEAAAAEQAKLAQDLRDQQIAAQEAAAAAAVSTSAAADQAIKGTIDTTLVELDSLESAAAETSTRVSSTLSAGLRSIEGDLQTISSTGAGAFDSIAEAADFAASAAESRFETMQMRLVGASIITDTVDEANVQIMSIGDAAEHAASAAEAAFKNSKFASGVEEEIADIKRKLQTATGDERRMLDQRLDELEAKRGSMRAFGGDDERRRATTFRGFAGESRSDGFVRNFAGDGGAGDITIKLVVDGQVLTEVVLRNQPRVLANKGLGRG